jgi:hypothetical protein
MSLEIKEESVTQKIEPNNDGGRLDLSSFFHHQHLCMLQSGTALDTENRHQEILLT